MKFQNQVLPEIVSAKSFQNQLSHSLILETNKNLFLCTRCQDIDPNIVNQKGGAFINKNSNVLDVMFIAQNPGSSNIGKTTRPEEIVPFGLDKENSYHFFFDQFVDVFKMKFKREPIIYVTNAIKCITINNEKPSSQSIDICSKQFLVEEIKYFNFYKRDFLVVLLGVVAWSLCQTNIIKVKNPIKIDHPGAMNRKGRHAIFKAINKIFEWERR